MHQTSAQHIHQAKPFHCKQMPSCYWPAIKDFAQAANGKQFMSNLTYLSYAETLNNSDTHD